MKLVVVGTGQGGSNIADEFVALGEWVWNPPSADSSPNATKWQNLVKRVKVAGSRAFVEFM